jgi:hypothetical protein
MSAPHKSKKMVQPKSHKIEKVVQPKSHKSKKVVQQKLVQGEFTEPLRIFEIATLQNLVIVVIFPLLDS